MDPIADMLIRIKNAQRVHKETASFGYSTMKWEVAKTLERLGYVGAVNRKGKKNHKLIEVILLYDASGKPKISEARRISTLGKRVYRGFRDIFPPRSGYGIAVYSTPKGILGDREAKKEKIGGEALFEAW